MSWSTLLRGRAGVKLTHAAGPRTKRPQRARDYRADVGRCWPTHISPMASCALGQEIKPMETFRHHSQHPLFPLSVPSSDPKTDTDYCQATTVEGKLCTILVTAMKRGSVNRSFAAVHSLALQPGKVRAERPRPFKLCVEGIWRYRTPELSRSIHLSPLVHN